jgi:Holliday junction resolvase RusA-like endonuclease
VAKNFTQADMDKLGLRENADGTWSKYAREMQKLIKPASLPRSSPTVKTVNKEVYTRQIIGDVSLSVDAKPLIVFDIDPIGAPRMTKSDQWKSDPYHQDAKKRQRKPVTQYFRFKNDIKAQATKMNFVLPESFHALCVIPMPHSWSDKKKGLMDGGRHQQKPDWDNIGKAICDTLMSNDAVIWDCRITKYWGRSGKIIIYKI